MDSSKFYKVKTLCYLYSLQRGRGLGDTLWHIEAFGGADFGVDQPLLEVSQRRTEPLLQQALLVLTLPGCAEAETGGGGVCGRDGKQMD